MPIEDPEKLEPDDLESRAEQELELARKAKDARAVSVHYKLACRYLDLLYPDGSPGREVGEARDEAGRGSARSKSASH